MTSRSQLARALDARLQPPYLLVVASAIVVLGLVMAVMLFATEKDGCTAFGIPLGADFSGFYVAAQILNRGQPEHLYDRSLHQRMYHELLPCEAEQVAIPYVHPPFVAGLLRPLAFLPYPVAYACWLLVSGALYVCSIWLLLKALRWPAADQKLLVLLLAISFEPFAFECWLGGQLSAIASFSFALFFMAMRQSKPFHAGIALGLCFYKPTLLILVLPLLVVGRRWQVLMGMTCTGIALASLSFLFVGWRESLSYISQLTSFAKSASGSDLDIRTWKYVDLNNCLRLLLGSGSPFQNPLMAGLGVIPLAALVFLWWSSNQFNEESQDWLWATTLSWIPVLNLYFGIYDSVLVVHGVLITAAMISLHPKSPTPLIDSGFAYLAVLIYMAPWFSQKLAAISGLSVYSFLLCGLGSFQLGALFAKRSQMPPTASSLVSRL